MSDPPDLENIDSPTPPAGRRLRWLVPVFTGVFFCLVFLLLLQAAMHKELNHDEQMYVSGGALMARSLWPYLDYPFFQMPLLALVYGAGYLVWGDLLLVGRLLNVLFAFGACLALFFLIFKVSRGLGLFLRTGLAVGSVLLYVSGSQFVYASGLAWNHDLPVMLTLMAVGLLEWRRGEGVGALPLLVSGCLLGLAISTRLVFLPAIVPFGLAVLLVPQTGRFALRLRALSLFCLGLAVGLLPSVVFLAMGPGEFYFGNVGYHGNNELYWQGLEYERAMSVADKLGYSFEVLVAEPSNWLLALGALAVLALLLHARSFVALLPLLAALALFVGALLPTPTWLQYFYAPYAVLAAAFALGTVYLARTRWRWWGVGLFALVAAVSVGFGAPRYLALGDLLAMGDWKPDMVSRVSGEIREVVSGGTVVTLSPIYPLQAGLDIYPGLASGPFGFRVADVLSPEERERHGLISVEEVLRMMSAQHPEAILTGAEGVLEYPLAYFATEYGYEQVELSNNLSLWVRPDKR